MMSKKELEVKEQEPVTTAIAEYNITEAALSELKVRLSGAKYEVNTTAGMETAKKDRRELVTLRTDLERKRKEIKAPALKYCKDIDEEAKRITAEIVELEQPIDEQIKAEEERKAAIKAEKERIEKERVDGIRGRIDKLKNFPVVALGAENAADLEMFIAKVEASPIGVEFEEFKAEAETAKAEAVGKLKDMLTLKQQQEAEAVRLEEERKENERKAELQGRVDAIKRVAITAASVQSIEELEKLKVDVGATDLAGLEEYEGAATEAITQVTADITAMIDQKKEALRLQKEREDFQRQQEADQKERDRVAAIKNLIADIKLWPSKCIGLSAFYIRSEIEGSEMDIPCKEKDFQEFTAEAEAERIIALGTMTNMAEAAEKAEQDAADLKHQQDELAAAQKKIDDEKAVEQAEREAKQLLDDELCGFDIAAGPDVTVETEMITITKTEYDQLVRDSEILSALRSAGVDNWDGYDIAMESLEVEA
jgi:hypothetical protein